MRYMTPCRPGRCDPPLSESSPCADRGAGVPASVERRHTDSAAGGAESAASSGGILSVLYVERAIRKGHSRPGKDLL